MTSRIVRAGLAGLMAVAISAPMALAQAVSGAAASDNAQTRDYQAQKLQYQQQQQDYQRAQAHYQDQADTYAARRDIYLRDRAAYDARYGSGAFVHYWRDHPAEYDEHYGVGAYDHDFAAPAG